MSDRKASMQTLLEESAFCGENASYLEEMLNRYLSGDNTLPSEWQDLIAKLAQNNDLAHKQTIEQIKLQMRNKYIESSGVASGSIDRAFIKKQVGVLELINAYRLHGHVKAKIDPLGLYESPVTYKELTLAYHGLSEADFSQEFEVRSFAKAKKMNLGKLIAGLEKAYCGSVGAEYMHIADENERNWLQERIETKYYKADNVEGAEKIKILERLTAAEGLEKYLAAKYPGAKRFSVEGGESIIVSLDEIIQFSGKRGVREIVIGMAHRGRLNVLVNNLGKSPVDLFDEFEGKQDPNVVSGDVKYHQGFSADISTAQGDIHVSLAFNPSHLEIVNPVVQGSVRARQTYINDEVRDKVVPVIIHGDSAVAGQGVVMECFNMSQTRGYGVGGSIHIIINNQVGFTTSNPNDTRSTMYCSDVAKSVQAPIFHVNGDCPESVYLVTRLALEYREKFKKDVVIDLVCYRRHGHNETDEPSATQPVMYKVIKKLATTRKLYAQKLTDSGVIKAEEATAMVAQNRKQLESGQTVAINISDKVNSLFDWSPFVEKIKGFEDVDTRYPLEKLKSLCSKISADAIKTSSHSRVTKILESREKMAAGELPLDWGFAENVAYASLLEEDYSIRISGQDSGRGTFFHRHIVIHDQETGSSSVPIKEASNSAKVEVIDSVLSEEAVLGFEYGYSTTDPRTLVVWEAQFGDFANGAQVVIDQFISSGEHKWGRYSGLTMLLPHGYEGMGPEHSSARLERFLQLCAEKNMRVCVPSTPAQAFHMLRRQMHSKLRIPLVVMSPKSILRNKMAVSTLEDLSNGKFELVIDDTSVSSAKKVVLCSGKVYYDLLSAKDKNQLNDIALVRVEQLYPFPTEFLSNLLAKKYAGVKEVVWCQEEPKNQGAWYSTQHRIYQCLAEGQTLRFAGRQASSSPATGYSKQHNIEQEQLVKDALS